MKTIYIHWSYTPRGSSYGIKDILRHQTNAQKNRTEKHLVGGLGLQKPIFTRLINVTGHLFPIQDEKEEIHICLVGGLNEDYQFCNTATTAQLLTLANELRSLKQSFPRGVIQSGDFEKFDLSLWSKAINL